MTVGITLSPSSGAAPFDVSPQLSVTISGAPVTNFTVNWEFGDGGVSAQASPSHTYQNYGRYSLRATVTIGAGSAESVETATVEVVVALQADLQLPESEQEGDAPHTINPRISSNSANYTVSWDFGDGTTSTSQTPSHTYSSFGVYTVTATVSDGAETHPVLSTTVAVVDKSAEFKSWGKIDVPNYNNASEPSNAKRTYLRMGASDPEDFELEFVGKDDRPDDCDGKFYANLALNRVAEGDSGGFAKLDGLLDYTAGNRTVYTEGNKEEYVGGKHRLTIAQGGLGLWDAGYAKVNYFRQVGSLFGATLWRHTTVDHASSDSYQFGDSESFFGGFTFSGTAGLSTGINLGGSLNLGAALNVDLGLSFDVSAKMGSNVDLVAEGQNTMVAENHDMIATDTIQIRVKGPAEKVADKVQTDAMKKSWKAYAASGSVVLAAVAAGGAGVAMPWWSAIEGAAREDADTDYSTWLSSVGMTLGTAIWAGTLLYGKAKNKAVDLSVKLAPSILDVSDKKIRIAVGAGGQGLPTSSYIEVTPQGIEIATGGPTGSKLSVKPTGIELQVGGPSNKVKMGPIGCKITGPTFAVDTELTTTIGGKTGVTIKGKPGATGSW